jgi:hypothetical protein
MTTPTNEEKKRKDAQAALRGAVKEAVQAEIETFRQVVRQVVHEELTEILAGLEVLIQAFQIQARTLEPLRLATDQARNQPPAVYPDVQPASQRPEYPQVESEEDDGTLEEDDQANQTTAAEISSRDPDPDKNDALIEAGSPQLQQRPESPVKRLRVGPSAIMLGLGGGVPRPYWKDRLEEDQKWQQKRGGSSHA